MWLSSVRLRNRRRIDAWTNLCWKTLNNPRWRMNFENLGNYHVVLKIFARSTCEFCWILVDDSVENCEKHWILELEKELSFYTWLLTIGNYALIVFKWWADQNDYTDTFFYAFFDGSEMKFDVNFINQMWKYNTNGWQRVWPVVKWTLYIIFIWARKTPISTFSTFVHSVISQRLHKKSTNSTWMLIPLGKSFPIWNRDRPHDLCIDLTREILLNLLVEWFLWRLQTITSWFQPIELSWIGCKRMTMVEFYLELT